MLWKGHMSPRAIKVSRSKTEYSCVNVREKDSKVSMQEEEIAKADEF